LVRVDVSPDRFHCWPVPLGLKRLADHFLSKNLSQVTEVAAFTAFDRWAASIISRLRPDIVVGYEGACAESFTAAQRSGALCVLDAAAYSHVYQDKLLENERRRSYSAPGRWIRARKAAEVNMADIVICCSNMAAESYRQAGVERNRLIVNPVGCDVTMFSKSPRAATGAAKFCFVGIASERKAFGLLLAAFVAHRRDNPDSELHIVGDRDALKPYRVNSGQDGMVVHGKKTHPELAEFLAAMDVLLLPSVLDSFGMVVPEALAAGAFVILSDSVGAGMVVTDERIGAIVPARDQAALCAAMSRVTLRLTEVRSQASLRRSVARDYDWSHYADRATKIFEAIAAQGSLHGLTLG
jgi:glycosyltransferase involved in cell wall biosynthesis